MWKSLAFLGVSGRLLLFLIAWEWAWMVGSHLELNLKISVLFQMEPLLLPSENKVDANISNAWENSKWQEQQMQFHIKNVGMHANGTFFIFKWPPLAMCLYCDSAHSLPHFIFSLRLGKIVSSHILVKGMTWLIIRYTTCPRRAGVICYLIFKLGASSRGFVHVWECYYPLEHGLERICQHFNVNKIFLC